MRFRSCCVFVEVQVVMPWRIGISPAGARSITTSRRHPAVPSFPQFHSSLDISPSTEHLVGAYTYPSLQDGTTVLHCILLCGKWVRSTPRPCFNKSQIQEAYGKCGQLSNESLHFVQSCSALRYFLPLYKRKVTYERRYKRGATAPSSPDSHSTFSAPFGGPTTTQDYIN